MGGGGGEISYPLSIFKRVTFSRIYRYIVNKNMIQTIIKYLIVQVCEIEFFQFMFFENITHQSLMYI